MKKSEVHKLVKESIKEIYQEDLNTEGRTAKFLGGLAFVAALFAGNARIDQSFYENDPQIVQLEKDLLQAKELKDKEKIKDLARQIKDRKIAVTQFK